MACGLLGQIVSPAAGNVVVPGVRDYIADNSVFGGKYPGDTKYLAHLAKLPYVERCRFAVAPDVVGDAAATLALAAPMLPRIRALGFPAALVAQNGLEHLDVPWGTFDALFIGGDTAWKLGPAAQSLTRQARQRGLWVHMGRVNSRRRVQHALHTGCNSGDGTYLAFAPDLLLGNAVAWEREANTQGGLWDPVGGVAA